MLRWLTLLGILFWFVAYWQGGRKVVSDIQKSAGVEDSRLDTYLMVSIVLSSVVVMGTGVLVTLGLVPLELPRRWVVVAGGWLLSVIGIVGMFYCRHYLGRFWTAETTLMDGHQVVDTGPYGVVRHPIYSFAIVMYVGVGIVFPVWWNLLLVLGIVGAYALKAQEEDGFLEEELEGYREYKERVQYRIIPWVW